MQRYHLKTNTLLMLVGQNNTLGEIGLKNISCCFTGHRQIEAEDEVTIKNKLLTHLQRLIELGVKCFYCGGALGFDTLAAICVLEKKKIYNDIALIMALPCKSQSKYFNKYEKQTYEYIISHADKVIYTSEKYLPGCMLERNKYMVDNCSFCVCYLRKNAGGTYYTERYAKSHGLDIFYV